MPAIPWLAIQMKSIRVAPLGVTLFVSACAGMNGRRVQVLALGCILLCYEKLNNMNLNGL